jgi:organic radical activating enzyme
VTYRINEIFYSLQGEGVRVGTPNIFIRFAGCNLRCSRPSEGFDCDTEFASGMDMTAQDVLNMIAKYPCENIILTGGEPSLQIDAELIDALKDYYLAIETNGTESLPQGIDWICCSPKTAEHTLRVGKVDELKYVRDVGQGIPKPILKADHYLISPAWHPEGLHPETLHHCMELVKQNPTWRLSAQYHKVWSIR